MLFNAVFEHILGAFMLATFLLLPIEAIRMPPHSGTRTGKAPPPDALRHKGGSALNREDPFHLGPLRILPTTPKKLYVPKANPKYIMHVVFSPKTQYVGNLDLMKAVGLQFAMYNSGNLIDTDKVFHTNAKTCTEKDEPPRLETVVHLDGAWGREDRADPKTIQNMLIHSLMDGLLRAVEWSVQPIYSDCTGSDHWQADRGIHNFNAACGGSEYAPPCPCQVANAVCNKVHYSVEMPVNMQAVLFNENDYVYEDHLSLAIRTKDLDKGHTDFCGVASTAIMIALITFGRPWGDFANALWLYCTLHMPKPIYVGGGDSPIPGWPPKNRKREFVRHPDNTESFTFEVELIDDHLNGTSINLLDAITHNDETEHGHRHLNRFWSIVHTFVSAFFPSATTQ